MPIKYNHESAGVRHETSPSARKPADAGDSCRVADENPLLFEHSGWALCNDASGFVPARPRWQTSSDPHARDGHCLVHVGCEGAFPNWHLSVMLWDEYKEDSSNRLVCSSCHSVLSKDAYDIFCKVYNLLNKS